MNLTLPRLTAIVLFVLIAISVAGAQDFMPRPVLGGQSLSAQIVPEEATGPAPGRYLAGDIAFTVDRRGEIVVLTFEASGESVTLTPVPVALGGRAYRNTAGETVLQMSGRGGLTLFAAGNDKGLPAARAR